MSLQVSAIVPTKNNERTIGALVRSLRDQRPSVGEIIVVDGKSTDRTVEIATLCGARVVSYDRLGDQRAFARNLGAECAKGDVFVFLDSDMEFQSGIIEECVARIESGADGVVIPEMNLGSGLIGLARSWERRLIERDNLTVVARVVRCSVFTKIGGFDSHVTGFEDLDFQARLLEGRFRLDRSTTPLIHHEEGQNLLTYLRKRLYYMRSAALYCRKHPGLATSAFSVHRRFQTYLSGLQSPRDVLPFLTAIILRGIEVVAMHIVFSVDHSTTTPGE